MKNILSLLAVLALSPGVLVAGSKNDPPEKYVKVPVPKTHTGFSKERPRTGADAAFFRHDRTAYTGPMNKPMQLNIALDAGFPAGKYANAPYSYGAGIGGTLMFLYYVPTVDRLALTASASFLYFGGSNYSAVNRGVTYTAKNGLQAIPVNIGLRYNFTEMFYGAVEIGYVSVTTKQTQTYSNGNNENVITNSDTKGYFGLAPSIGFIIPAGPGNIDLSGRFQYISTTDPFNYIGIRAGVGIPFGTQ